MKKHWLTLSADTFLWLTGTAGLAYNAKNKRQVRFSLTNEITAKCRQLLATENLYSIELTDKEIRNEEINQWVQLLINIEAGYLSYNVEFENKPVSLQPILKVQDKKNTTNCNIYKEKEAWFFKIFTNSHFISTAANMEVMHITNNIFSL